MFDSPAHGDASMPRREGVGFVLERVSPTRIVARIPAKTREEGEGYAPTSNLLLRLVEVLDELRDVVLGIGPLVAVVRVRRQPQLIRRRRRPDSTTPTHTYCELGLTG